jgi:D-arabinose 1-dehydrogenase-like Zn-dependent alcohol dehydrogenase
MAVVAYGDPLVEIDVPEPELKPGFALVDVLACGVCFSDVKTARGQMPFSADLALPHIPGHEVCGRVVATSSGGAFSEGDLVVVHHYWPCGRCRRCKAGDENLCSDLTAWMGFTHPGGFQERLAVPLDRLLRVPAGIDPTEAAPMTCALGTAYRAVITQGDLRAGMSAAVIGLGGVGIHALQVASAAGATVVGLDVSTRALEVARSLGLNALDATEDNLGALVAQAVGDQGFDLVIVTAGSEPAYTQAAELVRKGGRIVGVGYAMTTRLSLATPRLVLDEIEIRGSRYVSRGELESAMELVRTGRVRPIVDTVKPLEEVNDAFDELTAGGVVGRVVLRVADRH